MTSPHGDFQIVVGAEPMHCHRCHLPCPVSAWVEHGWELADGRRSTGQRQVALCLTCDLEDPHAGPLALFLRFHPEFTHAGGAITDAAAHEFARVIEMWLPHAQVPVVSEADFEADIAAYRRGDLD